MKYKNGQFQIGGVAVSKLKEDYGLPLFVYDTEKMTHQFERLKKAYQGIDLQLNYACKALSNLNVLKHFHSLDAGLDCVSIQEVYLGLKAGVPAEKIHFTPSGVSFAEIKEAVDQGVGVTLDSISLLEQFGNEYGDSYPICIRFNPHVMGGGNLKISTGHVDSKFGISVHQLRHVKRVVNAEHLKVIGVHMHTGSDILDIQTFIESAKVLMDVAKDFQDLDYIDFGSGFKVAYRPDDVTTDVERLGKEMVSLFADFCKTYGRGLKMILEPGKFLVSEAGYLLVEVNVIKSTPATVFAGVNSGLNHLIRPMFYDAYHHITNVSNPKGTPRIYSVVGYICETDTFASDRKINEIAEGDTLCFHNAGHMLTK